MNTVKQVKHSKNILQKQTTFKYIERSVKLLFHIVSILVVEIFRSCIDIFKTVEEKNIEGQVALVTGGGNGLGKEICVELAKRGCKVAIIDIDLPGATKTSEALKKTYGIESRAYKVDVRNYEEVEQLKPKIEKDLGTVDIIINNAGLTPIKTIDEYSPEYIRKIVDVNLVANIWTVKVFLPTMKAKKRGHIVQIASLAGLTGIPISSVYCATKFGVKGFMESLKMDLVTEDLENDIYTTTSFPYFIATNDELCNFLDANGFLHFLPAFSASHVAKKTVTAFLKNQEHVVIPPLFEWALGSMKFLPRRAVTGITKIVHNGAAKYKKMNPIESKSNGVDVNQNITEIAPLVLSEEENIVEKIAEKVVDNVLGKVIENVMETVIENVKEN